MATTYDYIRVCFEVITITKSTAHNVNDRMLRFAVKVLPFVNEVMQKELDGKFIHFVVLGAFHSFSLDGDIRRIISDFNTWIQMHDELAQWTTGERQQLADQMVEYALTEIYPDNYMYTNIVQSYCKTSFSLHTTNNFALLALNKYREILRTFEHEGHESARKNTMAPFTEWVSRNIHSLDYSQKQQLSTFLIQTIQEIYIEPN